MGRVSIRSQVSIAVAVLSAVTVLGAAAGCAGHKAGAGSRAAAVADLAASAGSAAPDAAGTPSASPASTATPSAAASAGQTAAPPKVTPPAGDGGANPPAAGCPRGAGLSAAWASWPMPNPRGSGLPNPASYTDLGNGTVRDNVTCLVWQRSAATVAYTFADAKAYCASLTLGGTGWHLPTRVELTSIVDTGRAGPAIDTAAFPGTPVGFFWTSTPWAVAHTPPYAWIINFYEGLASNAADQTKAYRVRCVRSPGGSGPATYRVISGEQVQDTRTGLVWQRTTSPTTMGAAAAAEYCRALGIGGLQWRLPSVKELATTVDDSRVAPAIDRVAFPGTAKSTWYWSQSVAKPDATRTWALNYDDGFTNYRNIPAGFVRCVR